MKQHNFTCPPNSNKARRAMPFTVHPCDSFETFQKLRPGALCELPEGYESLHAGFVAYRCDTGEVIGLADD